MLPRCGSRGINVPQQDTSERSDRQEAVAVGPAGLKRGGGRLKERSKFMHVLWYMYMYNAYYPKHCCPRNVAVIIMKNANFIRKE